MSAGWVWAGAFLQGKRPQGQPTPTTKTFSASVLRSPPASAWPGLVPLAEELAVGSEDLHPAILAVGDDTRPARSSAMAMRQVELPGPASPVRPRRTAACRPPRTCARGVAVAIVGIDGAVGGEVAKCWSGGDGNGPATTLRMCSVSRCVDAGVGGLAAGAERQERLPSVWNLRTVWSRSSVHQTASSGPDGDAVRALEDPLAPGGQKPCRRGSKTMSGCSPRLKT